MATYPVGQTFPATVTWRDNAGVITDPSTIELKVEDPAGTETTYTYPASLTKDATGVYSKQITLSSAGYWILRFRATGNGVDAVVTEVVEAAPSELVTDAGLEAWALVSLQETRAFLNVTGHEDDLEIVRLINDASASFLNVSEREIPRTASVTRTFDLDSLALYSGELRIGDAATVTAVTIADRYAAPYATVLAADYRLLPEVRFPWDPIRRIRFLGNTVTLPSGLGYRVSVTGEFGFPVVPGDVRQAILEEVEARHGKDSERRSDIFSEEAGDVFTPAPGADARSLTRQAFDVAMRYRDPVIA